MTKLFIRFLVIAISLSVASTASAQKSKASLQAEINTNLPDNSVGFITPSLLRSTLLDSINSWQQYAGVNPQTGTTYTFLASDYGQLVTFSNSSSIAASLPQATSSFSTY